MDNLYPFTPGSFFWVRKLGLWNFSLMELAQLIPVHHGIGPFISHGMIYRTKNEYFLPGKPKDTDLVWPELMRFVLFPSGHKNGSGKSDQDKCRNGLEF
ncbi:hypothetical protein [Pedobacter hiemivivus]|uniref:hypothetical protein n=1 Tax=Pedobacter hiemivivus TaxID=2530454 RepID=UPI00103DCCEE|nr:hypothetical protein [Pedobacter hiemivivus]